MRGCGAGRRPVVGGGRGPPCEPTGCSPAGGGAHVQGGEKTLVPDPNEPIYRALCPHANHGFDKQGRPVRAWGAGPAAGWPRVPTRDGRLIGGRAAADLH